MTPTSAGLATATVTLPPLATPSVSMKWIGVTWFILLGLSAWCGINAAKRYVAFGLGDDLDLGPLIGADPGTLQERKEREPSTGDNGGPYGNKILFGVGGLAAGVFLISNLLRG